MVHHHLAPSESAKELAIYGDGAGSYTPGEARDPRNARGRVVALYAGAAADLLLDPSCERSVRAHARHDDLEAARWLDRLGEREREVEYRDRARSMAVTYWREIEVVAAMLLDVDALRGDVAKMIVALVNGVDVSAAASRLEDAPEAALLIARAFAPRLAPGHVSEVLRQHGYDLRRRSAIPPNGGAAPCHDVKEASPPPGLSAHRPASWPPRRSAA